MLYNLNISHWELGKSMLRQERVVVISGGKPRRLFGLTEHPDGSVYVRLYSGKSAGPFDIDTEIQEHRFSLHPSPDLPYSKMHRHMKLRNGVETTMSSYVSAIKAGNGFSPVFLCRFANLNHEMHNIQPQKLKSARHLFPQGDYLRNTLFIGLFVGHRDAVFVPRNKHVIFAEWKFNAMKVLVLGGYSNFPATPFGLTSQAIGLLDSPAGEPELDAPLTPEECEDYFSQCLHGLQVSQLRDCMQVFGEGVERDFIEHQLKILESQKPESKFNLIGVSDAEFVSLYPGLGL